MLANWSSIVEELQNINDYADEIDNKLLVKEIGDSIYKFLSDTADDHNIDLVDVFLKDESLNEFKNILSEENIFLQNNSDGLYYIRIDDNNTFKMLLNKNSDIEYELQHDKQIFRQNKDKKSSNETKINWATITAIIVVIVIICAIIGYILYSNYQQQLQTKNAQEAFDKGVDNKIDKATDGKQVPDETTKIIDADGKEHYIANKTTDEQLNPTDEMQKARYIEDHPNDNYCIVDDNGNATKILNPQATIDENGQKVVTYYNAETKSYETKMYDEINGKITHNDNVISDKVLDAMCSSDVDSNGNVVYNNVTETVKVHQNNGTQSIEIEWKTQDGTTMKTFDNNNIVCKDGAYGTIEDGKFSPFPDSIQESIKKSVSQITTTYPQADMNSIINPTNVANTTTINATVDSVVANNAKVNKATSVDITNNSVIKKTIIPPKINLQQLNEEIETSLH